VHAGLQVTQLNGDGGMPLRVSVARDAEVGSIGATFPIGAVRVN